MGTGEWGGMQVVLMNLAYASPAHTFVVRYRRLALQKLKAELRSRALAGGAVMVKAAVDHTTVKHDSKVRDTIRARGSMIVARGTSVPSNSILLCVCGAAQGSSFRCDDGSSVRTKLILDCSGFGSKLVELEGDAVPGVQVQTHRASHVNYSSD
jgi:hypothetical protein